MEVRRLSGDQRRRVLASGCGAVSIALAEPLSIDQAAMRGEAPPPETMRALFKDLFRRGERYHDTGGIHAAALVSGGDIISHAEDVGRHNAVDKVIGGALMARREPAGLGLMVTGRISAELAFKAARASLAWVATVSVPTTLAVSIAKRAGVLLIGRAVSGSPQEHR